MDTIETKAHTLWNLYRNNEHAASVMSDVEHMRRRADTFGVGASLAIFGINITTRMTMRSPLFRMSIANMVFFAVAPTMAARYLSRPEQEERIANLWRIHENRQKQGLGGTYNSTGYHENMHQDSNYKVNNGLQFRMESLTQGLHFRPYLNTHFTRFSEYVEDYCDFQDDIDDVDLYEVDNFERSKIFQPKKEHVVGSTPAIPYDDNDENLHFYDIQGESLYTNPPDTNMLTVDHGLEEDHVWAFRLTTYNQKVITNQYKNNIYAAAENSYAPFWGHKLATPSFHREHKVVKFMRHWDYRKGLELIKLDQALNDVVNNGKSAEQNKRDDLAQVQTYIAKVKADQLKHDMENVFITDHKHKPAKLNTLSEEEDEHFYQYMKELESYKKAKPAQEVVTDSGRFEKGSMLQRMFEPLTGATRNENGTLVLNIVDKELAYGLDEETMRGEFERANMYEPFPTKEWDIGVLRNALYDELRENTTVADEWDKILNKELAAIKDNGEYSAVADMRNAFDRGSKTSTFMKMLRTVPEHAFWDIKKPLTREENCHMNPYNPSRQVPFSSFFDARAYDQYLLDRELNSNLLPDISRHRRY